MTTITHLLCEYRANPLGMDVRRPRLSWQLRSDRRGAAQTAYQLRAAGDGADLASGKKLLWDSGKIASDQSILVPYGGPALRSGQRIHWQVRAWDETGAASAWSEVAWWEMGLLEAADWQAAWITPDWDEDTTQSQPQPVLRREFKLDGAIKTARVYVTSLGLYELHLNGQRVGEDVLTPGWTAYDKRIQYQTYDVTGRLHAGENAIGALLGDGWYRGWLGFEGNRNVWGDRLGLLLQLHVTYADGRTVMIGSDGQWRATTGPIRLSDLYNGETYDARLELPGWDAAGYDDGAWQGVRKLDHTKETLIAQAGPAIIRNEELKPVKIIHTPAGETVFDFGQNMVGWVRLKVAGPAGTTVTLRHFEALDQQGNVYLTNLRKAQQALTYTLKGDGVETYEPRFTFMGFQFVAVEGWPGEPTLDSPSTGSGLSLTGVVVHSDIPSTGDFACSNPLINQLQHNIVWGQKGNFVDVPTDCPQRDERLGWMGDAGIFWNTACFNMDMAAFTRKWM
ncbi:MAG: alpha-L-rhamnosidase, partial [Chloroflexota bacterium]|nr:alpha-L-rhamnosidase [Chloroflexota bacterium]